MRVPVLVAALAVAAIGAAADPAQAYDYGAFSGRGFNPVFLYGVPPQTPLSHVVAGYFGIQTDEVPLGTAAKPAPVYPPALLFRLYPSTIYNAPPAASDLYRIVPLR